MKVGLFINTQFPEGFNLTERIPEMVAQVRAARDAGFASLWFPHHWLTHPMQMLQITPVMGYVAAHAQGMTIGPNILILPPLNPVHVAEEAATLDVLTGGNYILGLGLGQKRLDLGAELRIAQRPDFALQRQLDAGQAEAAQHQDDKKVGHETAGEGQEDNYSRGKVHGLFLGQG